MVYALFISLILAGSAVAQAPVKTPATQTPTKSQSLPVVEKLTSTEGRFSIALPKDTAEFEEIKPSPESPKETGGKYAWTLEKAVINVDYSDDPDFVIKTNKDYADLAEGMEAGIAAFGGTILSKKAIKLGRHRGYEIRFEDPDKLRGISRFLIVNGRKYTLFGLGFPGVPDSLNFIAKTLDSFKLTTSKP